MISKRFGALIRCRVPIAVVGALTASGRNLSHNKISQALIAKWIFDFVAVSKHLMTKKNEQRAKLNYRSSENNNAIDTHSKYGSRANHAVLKSRRRPEQLIAQRRQDFQR